MHRLPKDVIEKLCSTAPLILSSYSEYNISVLTYTLKLISSLVQLCLLVCSSLSVAECTEIFVKNDLIKILRTLFENSESTPLMCEFFIVILNQLAMDGSLFASIPLQSEQLHEKLIREIGFTLIQNLILLFVQRLNMDPSHSHIVELCFIYLLRLFGNHPAETIRRYSDDVVPLLHFLYECLYKPCFLPVDENDETLATGGFTQIQTQSNVLMDYVMTLFALLCYNSAIEARR